MKNILNNTILLISSIILFISCQEKEPIYILQKEDIKVNALDGQYSVQVGQLLRANVESINDENVTYEWLLDNEKIAATKNLEYMIEVAGEYKLLLRVTQAEQSFDYEFNVNVIFNSSVVSPPEGSNPYITKVLDYMPAVGQFVNKLPVYKEGDTQEDMNRKVLEAIGNNKKGMVTLGGYGGYVIVGFDHTIENKEGLRDFRVIANAFYAEANPDADNIEGGSCEPGIIMVAYDANGNQTPDENEWYEIEGSSHVDPTLEPWYQKAVDNNNNVNFYNDYEITYHKPSSEPSNIEEWATYIKWEDNKSQLGYKVKNQFHRQPYFPLWYEGDKLTFKGSCLPQNGIDESGVGNYYVLYKFRYGYMDNEVNDLDNSAIDIDWAINNKGQRVKLPGVDFIKIYTGVNQENGWLGENSTEVMGVNDLHLLGEEISLLCTI